MAATVILLVLGSGVSIGAAQASPQVRAVPPAATVQDASNPEAAWTSALPEMTVVMHTKPSIIVQGARSKLVAKLTKNGKPFAGQKMTLWQRPSAAGSQWQRVGTISTNSEGNAIYKVKPAINMRYQARFAERAQYRAAESNSAQVSVRTPIEFLNAVVLPDGSNVSWAGQTSPRAKGANARLQCRDWRGNDPNPFATVGSAVVRPDGRFSNRFAYTGTFDECRVFIPSTKWLSSNWSVPDLLGYLAI